MKEDKKCTTCTVNYQQLSKPYKFLFKKIILHFQAILLSDKNNYTGNWLAMKYNSTIII